MGKLLVALFWLSVLASLSVYAYRFYRRVAGGPKAKREDAELPLQTQPPRPNTVHTDLDAVLGKAAMAAEASPMTPEVDAETPSRSAAAESGRSGLFASSAAVGNGSGSAARASTEARPTVADTLEGIVLPCDLVPVVVTGAVLDPYRVAFSTHSVPAATVGAALGDELERLGFTLKSIADNQLEATKGDRQLKVVIHADAATVVVADAPAYPSLPQGSVVVEFKV